MINISHDKLLHYVVGTIVYALCSMLIGMYALIVVVVIAVGKEAYDYYTKKGTPEVMDAVATVLGGVVGLVTQFIGGCG